MPNRSPGNVPARTIRDLGLPPRAVTALTRAGITGIDDLALLTRRDLATISGLGPGMIAAIRVVVPEPPRGVHRSGASPDTDHEERPPLTVDPESETAEDESPAAPEIPSFDSLRTPRRRSAIDLLLPAPPSAPAAPAPAPAAAPRPAEYADLLHLGVRAARAVAGVPGRMVRWSAREPARCLRRLLG